MAGDDKLFRFEDLVVWQRAADLADSLDNVAAQLEQLRRFKYADQRRGAALSISNNIAEGSGNDSSREFRKFLVYSRRSAFECASMMLIFERKRLVPPDVARPLLIELNEVSRMITALWRSLQ